MFSNCNCNMGCAEKSVVVSLIIGIIAAVLRFNATIVVTPAFLWVIFGIATVFLGIILLTSACCGERRCECCERLNLLLAGALGTILTAIILLAITFPATSVLGAIITGIALFFFSLTITGAACLIKCRSNCN
jgi:hypothetical protein